MARHPVWNDVSAELRGYGHRPVPSVLPGVGDRRPDAIHSVVVVGGFPEPDGAAYADFFEAVDG